MASLIIHPDVKEFIDMITGHGGDHVQVEEMTLKKIRVKLSGENIREMNIRLNTGVNVIGLKKADGTFVVNPDINEKLEDDVKLILLGTHEQMHKLKELL